MKNDKKMPLIRGASQPRFRFKPVGSLAPERDSELWQAAAITRDDLDMARYYYMRNVPAFMALLLENSWTFDEKEHKN